MDSSTAMQPNQTGASRELVDGLSHALNREISTILRYLVQGSLVMGAQWSAVREMYHAEAVGEMVHAKYLADKLAILGEKVTLNPELPNPPRTPQEMLRNDIREELVDVAGYKKLAELADREGLIELKVQMENQAADEEGHAEVMTRLLGEPL
jgi:bacterioferritin (cytochrome b1)